MQFRRKLLIEAHRGPQGALAAAPPKTRSSATCRRNSEQRSAPSSISSPRIKISNLKIKRDFKMGSFDPKQFQELIAKAQRQAQELQSEMQRTIVEASS